MMSLLATALWSIASRSAHGRRRDAWSWFPGWSTPATARPRGTRRRRCQITALSELPT